MPPRKRARISHAASPTPTSQPKTPTPAETTANKPTGEDTLNDPWTDEEEIGLFKGLIRWKPTGIHKHFRMIQLRSYLLENHYIHSSNAHTTAAGIWRKLESLYDLEALDEREDARQLSELSGAESEGDEEQEDDAYSLAANKIHSGAFGLPQEDFGDKLWAQRFASEKERRDESPLALPEVNLAAAAPVEFTPSFSIEPSEVATPISRAPRGRPPRGSGRGRGAARAAAAAAAAATRRSGRHTDSVVADSEEAVSNEESSDGDEESEEEEKESQKSTPVPKSERGRRGRGRGGPATRGRGRGRGRRRGF